MFCIYLEIDYFIVLKNYWTVHLKKLLNNDLLKNLQASTLLEIKWIIIYKVNIFILHKNFKFLIYILYSYICIAF